MEQMRNEFTEGIKKDMYAYSLEKYPTIAPVSDSIFEVVQSKSAYELSNNVIGAGKLKQKPEGEPISFSKVGEGFTVSAKNVTFDDGLQFTMEAVMDMNPDKIANLVRDMAGTWTEGWLQTQEEYCANIFNYGGYTAGNTIFNGSTAGFVDPSGDLAYDGKPFINLTGNKRPLYPGAAATHYNGVALGLNEANLQTAYDLMTVTNAVDSRGQKVSVSPDILLYHPSLRWTVKNLLESQNVVGNANNDINTVKGLLIPVEWRFLNTSTFWALGKAKKGIKKYNRMPLTFDFWYDQLTKGYKASVVARIGVEVNDFRYWVGSNAPTS